MGQLTSKVFAKYGYSLILVDSNLNKLQMLEEELNKVFMNIAIKDRIQIINVNFSIWKDSASLEAKLKDVISLEKDIPIFMNCISFINEW